MMMKYKQMCIILNMVLHLGYFFFTYDMMETDSVLEMYLRKPKVMVGVRNNSYIHATGGFE